MPKININGIDIKISKNLLLFPLNLKLLNLKDNNFKFETNKKHEIIVINTNTV